MRRAGYLDVKGKLYPGMRHEILNEKRKKKKVWHDVFVYMKKKGFKKCIKSDINLFVKNYQIWRR